MSFELCPPERKFTVGNATLRPFRARSCELVTLRYDTSPVMLGRTVELRQTDQRSLLRVVRNFGVEEMDDYRMCSVAFLVARSLGPEHDCYRSS